MLTTSRIASAAFCVRRDDMPRPFKPAVDFFDLVDLEHVAFLDVVEAGQLDAALVAFADFLGVVLFTPQRVERHSRR